MALWLYRIELVVPIRVFQSCDASFHSAGSIHSRIIPLQRILPSPREDILGYIREFVYGGGLLGVLVSL